MLKREYGISLERIRYFYRRCCMYLRLSLAKVVCSRRNALILTGYLSFRRKNKVSEDDLADSLHISTMASD